MAQKLTKVKIEKINTKTFTDQNGKDWDRIDILVEGKYRNGVSKVGAFNHKDGDEVEIELYEEKYKGETEYKFRNKYEEREKSPEAKTLPVGKYIPTSSKKVWEGEQSWGKSYLFIHEINGEEYSHFANEKAKDLIEAKNFELEVHVYLGRTEGEIEENEGKIEELVNSGIDESKAREIVGKKVVRVNEIKDLI